MTLETVINVLRYLYATRFHDLVRRGTLTDRSECASTVRKSSTVSFTVVQLVQDALHALPV